MCGRYVIEIENWGVYEHAYAPFSLTAPTGRYASYNVAPTTAVPTIRRRDNGFEGALLRWQMVPFWAKGVPPKYSTINATVEKIDTAPTWRGPWKRGHRCVMLASGFYEWQVRESGKQPYYIRAADQDVFGFAALWDRSVTDAGEAIESCAIITMPATPLMATIHNTKFRMPAILAREDWQAWLIGSTDDARGALRQYPDDLLNAHPVSARVNKPANNDVELLRPVAA
jgi:putative SOS response-associated peptidase YedK